MAFKETILITSRGKTCNGKRHRRILSIQEAIKNAEARSQNLSLQDVLDELRKEIYDSPLDLY